MCIVPNTYYCLYITCYTISVCVLTFDLISLPPFLRRAIEVWGSWQVLESEQERRRKEMEEEERRRQGEC